MVNTNVEGKLKIAYALTAIRGLGRRFAHIVCRRANVDLAKRAGELTPDEVARLVAVIENPAGFDIPAYLYNRKKDRDTGKSMHLVSSAVDTALRNDLERLKRNRVHRGLRHHWKLRVRGQHMNANSRHR
jgi:small subunit ribosomal protein S18e